MHCQECGMDVEEGVELCEACEACAQCIHYGSNNCEPDCEYIDGYI